jgi:hypothetical protein
LSKNNFKASQWFLTAQEQAPRIVSKDKSIPANIASALAPFIANMPEEKSSISNYFIPNWEGTNPHNKDIASFNNLISSIHKDVFDQFLTFKRFTPKIKKGIF